MLRPASSLAFLVSLACLVACTAKLTGSLDFNGKNFVPSSCGSLQHVGGFGVQLEDKDDSARIRVVQELDGSGVIHVDDGARVTTFKGCAKVLLERQNSSVNRIQNVKGSATIDCTSGEDRLTGTVTFENCH